MGRGVSTSCSVSGSCRVIAWLPALARDKLRAHLLLVSLRRPGMAAAPKDDGQASVASAAAVEAEVADMSTDQLLKLIWRQGKEEFL